MTIYVAGRKEQRDYIEIELTPESLYQDGINRRQFNPAQGLISTTQKFILKDRVFQPEDLTPITGVEEVCGLAVGQLVSAKPSPVVTEALEKLIGYLKQETSQAGVVILSSPNLEIYQNTHDVMEEVTASIYFIGCQLKEK